MQKFLINAVVVMLVLTTALAFGVMVVRVFGQPAAIRCQ
jgi:hypothetical protein